MTGLDTNVLVRYLVQDDAVQSPKATTCIESFTAEERGFVSLTTLIEVVWVLTSCYDMEKNGLIKVIDALLRTNHLLVEQRDVIWRAIHLFRLSKADFEDCLIACSCRAAGCDEILTFDALAAKTAGMRLLK